MKSSIPYVEYAFMMCQSTGRPPSSTIGLGRVVGLLADTGAQAARQDHRLHRQTKSGRDGTAEIFSILLGIGNRNGSLKGQAASIRRAEATSRMTPYYRHFGLGARSVPRHRGSPFLPRHAGAHARRDQLVGGVLESRGCRSSSAIRGPARPA